jgi:hypothetical protein
LVELANGQLAHEQRESGAGNELKYEIVIDVTFWCAMPAPDGVECRKTQ